MVNGIESLMKPNYNAVKINITNPQVNKEHNEKCCQDCCVNDDNGIYNAVAIDVDNAQVNTGHKHNCEPKRVYDYPVYDSVVTYDMTGLAPVSVPQIAPVYHEYQSVVFADEAPETDLKKDEIVVPEPNYTTVEKEKGLNYRKNNNVTFHGAEAAQTVKKPEIIKGEDIKPDVDISKVVENLDSEDFDVQAKQMEEIAKKGLENKENAKPYIVRDVFTSLINTTKKETVNLTPPSDAQIEARKKIIMNAIAIEQNPNITPDKLPFAMTKEDIAMANEISPMEQAERNKEYAIYTMAILSKIYADEIEEKTGNVVPLTDLPGASEMVDVLRYNPNAGVKVAAIDGLRHIQRAEYKDELATIYSLAQQDTNPMVSMSAEHALRQLNQ